MAADLLTDIAGAYPDGRPARDRLSFVYLDPEFSMAEGVDLVEKLVNTYQALTPPERRVRFRNAIVQAANTCAVIWVGLKTALDVTELAIRIAPERLSPALWRNLLTIEAPSPELSALWLQQLVRLLEYRKIQLDDVTQVAWVDVVRRTDMRGLPVVARWALGQLRTDCERSLEVLDAAYDRIRDEKAEVSLHWSDGDAVSEMIEKAFLSGLPASERRACRRGGRRPPLTVSYEDDVRRARAMIRKRLRLRFKNRKEVSDEIAWAKAVMSRDTDVPE